MGFETPRENVTFGFADPPWGEVTVGVASAWMSALLGPAPPSVTFPATARDASEFPGYRAFLFASGNISASRRKYVRCLSIP